MSQDLRSPFPWFGGKRRVAREVWSRFGEVDNYVEPFFGSGAVLLEAPSVPRDETINDLDGFVANFWRALACDPDAVAEAADWPVNEADLHARHVWLLGQREDLTAHLMGDPDFYDTKIAGWWVWGICSWIGSGWCAGTGPWQSVDGRLTKGNAGRGVNRKRPHLGNAGRGVNRGAPIYDYMRGLAHRLRRTRVCCGDWQRVLGPSPTTQLGLTGVFLDPPYLATVRDADLYATDSDDVAHAVREWAIAHGDEPKMRIALCGYEGEHEMPESWSVHAWKSSGAYVGSDGTKERVWFSPHCMSKAQGSLW